ncbi:MAG: symmetrical bis(5'-nucleosyl)-tetraphosphatase [Thiotrichaceae bacterium]|nr:symmetrical bis(5'-nucleosyl)-tetraphosphatase [Thiotrichaceae bacterium]
MTDYAVGDIQGCHKSLNRLLKKIKFDSSKDCLWVAGDLVNRGKDSLAVLRQLKTLGNAVKCVLGNHDVSLIAMHYGLVRWHPTLLPIAEADDRDDLIAWLIQQPFLRVDTERKFCMAHAGVPPQWKMQRAIEYAEEITTALQGSDSKEWLANVYGDKPKKWKKSLQGYERHRYILNAFTRMRYLKKKGGLNFSAKNAPNASSPLTPWYQFPKRKNYDYTIVFGHWASLGFYSKNKIIGLDTGCVWKGRLTAINLDSIHYKLKIFSISCKKKSI